MWRQLLEHWLIGVFLGVLVALSLAAMARLSPLRLMDWLGADAVAESAARAGAADQDWTPRIVFLSIDDTAMKGWRARTGLQARGNISKLIGQVRQSGAKLVVLDIVFEPLSVSPHCDDAGCPRRPAGLSDDDLAVKEALEKGGAPLIIAAPISLTFQDSQTSTELWPTQIYSIPPPAGVELAYSFFSPLVIRSQQLFYNVFVHTDFSPIRTIIGSAYPL
jgi:CHASE2 domain-containing sensor protein